MTSATMSSKKDSSSTSRFPIPQSLLDLEHEPYNLLPYPLDFEDDQHNDEIRMNSFTKLLHHIEQGNRSISTGSANINNHELMMNLFLPIDDDGDDQDPWMDETRIQALYTLVRYVSFIVVIVVSLLTFQFTYYFYDVFRNFLHP
jgi:hypothetical protein